MIRKKINDLLQKGIIKETTHEEGEFISPTFIKHKPDGDVRLIFNAVAIRTALVRRPPFAIRTGVSIPSSMYGIGGGCAPTSSTRFRVSYIYINKHSA